MPKFDPTSCKTQLKLAMSRIKLQKNKHDNLSKNGQRAVADFLKGGKEGDARVAVENVIKDDFTIETLELMELFCELLMSRLSSIQSSKECPADLKEAVCTIIYASPRLDIKELSVIRDQFISKFGKQFAQDAMANKDGCVNARIVHKLGVLTPENYLVYQYLSEIAKNFGVNWKPPQNETISAPAPKVSTPSSSEPLSLSFPSPPTHTGGQKQAPSTNAPSSFPSVPEVPVPSFNINDLPGGGGGGLSFPTPPSSSNSNSLSFPSPPNSSNSKDPGLSFPSPPSSGPSLDFPAPPSSKDSGLSFPSPPSNSEDKSGVPDFDELTARFERLKKRDQ